MKTDPRTRQEHQPVRLERVERAQDRSDVAGVLHAVEREIARPRERLRALRPRQAAGEHHALRRFGRGDELHHVLRYLDKAYARVDAVRQRHAARRGDG